jgi:alanyl-tRNA synthetase
MNNFQKTLNQGMKYFNKISKNTQTVTGKQIFDLQTSFGLPFDFIAQLAKKSDKILEVDIYKKLLAEHKMISKNGLVK